MFKLPWHGWEGDNVINSCILGRAPKQKFMWMPKNNNNANTFRHLFSWRPKKNMNTYNNGIHNFHLTVEYFTIISVGCNWSTSWVGDVLAQFTCTSNMSTCDWFFGQDQGIEVKAEAGGGIMWPLVTHPCKTKDL